METSNFYKGLVFGGVASCTAECVSLPIDMVKVRMQIQGRLASPQAYRNFWHAFVTIAKTEGPGAFFTALPPALLRQSTYGSLRYGLYTPFKRMLGTENVPSHQVELWKKMLAGCGSGAISSAICTPTDLVKIRMQAQGFQVPGITPTRHYTSLWDAFRHIVKEEGFLALYKGVGPTCTRATVLAASELATYDEIKAQIAHRQLVPAGFASHLVASLSAGFISVFASNPFDFAKSRVMSQAVDSHGRGILYRNMFDCMVKSVQREGVTVLWSGFWPNFGRTGPNIVVVYMLMEQLKALFDSDENKANKLVPAA